jgi:hypothetical protein
MIALGVFFSGVIFVPAMGLPRVGFNWQRYAGVYNPASLQINHPSGSPGSYFTITGTGFSPETVVNVVANGVLLGEMETSETGDLLFLINSSGADEGYYQIEVTGNEAAATQLILDVEDPTWPAEDEGPVFNLPAGIAQQVLFLPVIEQ